MLIFEIVPPSVAALTTSGDHRKLAHASNQGVLPFPGEPDRPRLS
jgi:hypothetical protein